MIYADEDIYLAKKIEMKTIYTLLITLIAAATTFAQPIQCFFALSTESPREVMKATDQLMNSEFGKSFPASVALYQEAFNGEQAPTHTLGFPRWCGYCIIITKCIF